MKILILSAVLFCSAQAIAAGSVVTYRGYHYDSDANCQTIANDVAMKLEGSAWGDLKVMEAYCVSYTPIISFVTTVDNSQAEAAISRSETSHRSADHQHLVADLRAFHAEIVKTFESPDLKILETGDDYMGSHREVRVSVLDRRGFRLRPYTYTGLMHAGTECGPKLAELLAKARAKFTDAAGYCLRAADGSNYSQPVLFFFY